MLAVAPHYLLDEPTVSQTYCFKHLRQLVPHPVVVFVPLVSNTFPFYRPRAGPPCGGALKEMVLPQPQVPEPEHLTWRGPRQRGVLRQD